MNDYTSFEIAKWLGIEATTVHRWAADYAELLNPGANPPKGKDRRFTSEDCKVLWTVKTLRDANLSHGEIKLRLQQNERILPSAYPDELIDLEPTYQSPQQQLAALRLELAEKEQQITQLQAENERLKGQNEALMQQLEAQRKEIWDLVLRITRGE